MYCRKCGKEISANTKFCRYCGTPITAAQSGQPDPGKKPKKPGLIIGIIAAILIVIVAVLLIVLLVTNKKDDSHEVVSETGQKEQTIETAASEIASVESEDAEVQTESSDQEAGGEGYVPIGQDANGAEISLQSSMLSDEEWHHLSHGVSCIVGTFEQQLFPGDHLLMSDLGQTEYNALLSEYMRGDYSVDYLTDIRVHDSGSNRSLDLQEANALVRSLTGNYEYNATSEGSMTVAGDQAQFTLAFGAPIHFARQIGGSADGEKIRSVVEVAEIANVYSTSKGIYEVTFVPDEASIFGYHVEEISCISYPIQIASATASSKLIDDGSTTKYQASNVYDHDMKTAWVEGVQGLGQNEWIQLNLSGPQTIHGLHIGNGYYKNQATYTENASPSRIMIEFDDNTYITVDLNGSMDLFRSGNEPCSIGMNEVYGCIGCGPSDWNSAKDYLTSVSFGCEVTTSTVKIYILDATRGTVYEDTCITEIALY